MVFIGIIIAVLYVIKTRKSNEEKYGENIEQKKQKQFPKQSNIPGEGSLYFFFILKSYIFIIRSVYNDS